MSLITSHFYTNVVQLPYLAWCIRPQSSRKIKKECNIMSFTTNWTQALPFSQWMFLLPEKPLLHPDEVHIAPDSLLCPPSLCLLSPGSTIIAAPAGCLFSFRTSYSEGLGNYSSSLLESLLNLSRRIITDTDFSLL